MSPTHFNELIEAYEDELVQKIKDQDRLNWILGNYIYYAFNDPKKYPEAPLLEESEKKEGKAQTPEEMEEVGRQLYLKYGKKK